MTEPNGSNYGRNDSSWQRDNNVQYAQSRLEYSTPSSMPPAAAMTGANIYMMPNNQDVYMHPTNHQMHRSTIPQPMHQMRTIPPASYMQHTEYVPVTRNDNFTVVRTPHGEFLKVFYNNDDATNFNNYELFSGKSCVPHHMMEQTQPQPPPQPNQQEHFYHYHPSNAPQLNGQQSDERNLFSSNDNNNTNFLNQLVGNWMPNMSGTYSPFGESPLPPQSIPSTAQSTSIMQTHIKPPTTDNLNSNTTICNENVSTPEDIICNNTDNPSKNIEMHLSSNNQQTKRTNGSFVQDNINGGNEKKTRMIAEVKPMRMSYSDVLSKNVFINRKNSIESNGNSNTININLNQINNSTTSNAQPKSSKVKANHSSSDKKSSNHTVDDKDANGTAKFSSKNGSQNISSGQKISTDAENEINRDNRINEDSKNGRKKIQTANVSNKNPNRTKNSNQTDTGSKRRSDINTTIGYNIPQSTIKGDSIMGSDKSQMDTGPTNNGNSNGYFYNITKNDLQSQSDKSTSNTIPNKSSYQYRKTTALGKSAGFNRTVTGNSSRSEKSQQKRLQRTRDNTKYALTKKFVKTWFEYLLRFVYWLIALVCDVIVLSLGILVDRISAVYDYLRQFFLSLRYEFLNNSGRPTTYFWNLWKRFDKCFDKESKWAFWRRIFAKKKIPEPTTDYYKNGRLPQTGEEAMYSLLNCKGKDAYSILGVQSDCSQEQIRKHYKKIAVLVHPDKNKQPGAEEAFKILQRAFELIGEPENRKSYDQSVAEALNAEKAWSELNDLLRQLQTKIAEAANTIRCSSCGLRHPRKPTGRPHFAARQCSTCKIRHTAREGDIWAETTFFGLRWKYLALMEGKVLDITEWANCQKGALAHLQPNSHVVQYRIVLGGQQQNQQPTQQDKERLKRDQPTEPSLDDFLDNLYSGQNPQNSSGSGSRRRNRKN